MKMVVQQLMNACLIASKLIYLQQFHLTLFSYKPCEGAQAGVNVYMAYSVSHVI